MFRQLLIEERYQGLNSFLRYTHFDRTSERQNRILFHTIWMGFKTACPPARRSKAHFLSALRLARAPT